MKKLLVLVFVASAMLACSKNKPAAQTTPPPAADQKMEGEPKTEGTTEGGDKKPDGEGGAAADPCAAPK